MNDKQASHKDSFELLKQVDHKIDYIVGELIRNIDAAYWPEHWLHDWTQCIYEYFYLFFIHTSELVRIADEVTDCWKLSCNSLLDEDLILSWLTSFNYCTDAVSYWCVLTGFETLLLVQVQAKNLDGALCVWIEQITAFFFICCIKSWCPRFSECHFD